MRQFLTNAYGFAVLVTCMLVSMLVSPSYAQTNNFVMELRITSPDVANGGSIVDPSVGDRVRFYLEARATALSLAPGQRNYGVGRVSSGPVGQTPAFIQLTDGLNGSRLLRSEVGAVGTGANAGVPLTGRMNPFRTGGTSAATVSPWHSRDLNGTGGAVFPSGTGNAMGAFDLDGDRIYGFDCYGSGTRAGETNPYLAFWPEVALGAASEWIRVYAFEVRIDAGAFRQIRLDAAGYMSAYTTFIDLGGSWSANLTGSTTGSQSVSTSFVFDVSNVIDPPSSVEIASVVWPAPAGNGNTYKVFRSVEPLTAEQAKSFASRQLTRKLVSITSEAEQAFVDGFVASVPDAFEADGRGPWIGFSTTGPGASPWAWNDQSSVTFTRWAGGHPLRPAQTGWNAALERNSATTTAWIDEPSTALRNTFVVEIPGCNATGNPYVLLSSTPAPVVTTSTTVQALSATSVLAGPLQWRLNGQNVAGVTGSSVNLSLVTGGGFFDAFGTSACGTPVFSSAVAVSRCTTGFNAWSAQSLQARLEHQIAWDSTTSKFIAFGGTLGASMPFHFNDTLELVGQSWLPVPVEGPSGRFDHAMCEAPGGGVLLFGGRGVNGVVSNETWLYRNQTWTQVSIPEASRPTARGGHEMVYDSVRNVVVMFGGFGAGPTFASLGDTWEFDGQSWTQRTGSPSPSARFGHAMGFDKVRGVTLLHGGFGTQRLGDTWTFNGTAWQSVAGFAPSARLGASMHFDAGRRAIVMIGGSTNTQASTDQQWVYGVTGWSQLTTPFPGGTIWAHDAAAAPNGQNVVAGGARGTSPLDPIAATWNGPSQAVIGVQPADSVAGDFGSALQLNVQAYGQGLTYRWRRDGVDLVESPSTSGVTTPTLTLSPLSSSLLGVYDVVVGGLCGLGEISQPSSVIRRCGLADVGRDGGATGADGRLDNNDFIVFIDGFFAFRTSSDVGGEGGIAMADGMFDNNDFIVFIQRFFVGCE